MPLVVRQMLGFALNNTRNEFKKMKKKTTKYLHAKNKNNVNMNNRNFCDRHVIYEKKIKSYSVDLCLSKPILLCLRKAGAFLLKNLRFVQ